MYEGPFSTTVRRLKVRRQLARTRGLPAWGCPLYARPRPPLTPRSTLTAGCRHLPPPPLPATGARTHTRTEALALLLRVQPGGLAADRRDGHRGVDAGRQGRHRRHDYHVWLLHDGPAALVHLALRAPPGARGGGHGRRGRRRGCGGEGGGRAGGDDARPAGAPRDDALWRGRRGAAAQPVPADHVPGAWGGWGAGGAGDGAGDGAGQVLGAA